MAWLYILPVVLLFCLLLRTLWIRIFKQNKNICIVVLGDLGRSPRMQYHAISFAREGFTVDIIGYPGSLPLKDLTENPFINIYYMKPPPNMKNTLPYLVFYVFKTSWQVITLLWRLFFKQIPNYLMIQNPPAIPTIPICWFYCVILNVQFIIDWHNYAHSLLALSLGEKNVLVKLAKFIETFFGIRAHSNFCVTKAMKEDLSKKWNIKAYVLYDRPSNEFHSIPLVEKHELLLKLSKDHDVFKGSEENSTVFTQSLSSGICLSPKRPGFIISSTSWTEDEDFSILLSALEDYENTIVSSDLKLPDLICVITGKGPLKEFYSAIIKLKEWKHITIVTPWLENEDYPKMLASADLGISLHTSSSGLDLPMKVVDMFGCCLPVCAYNFKCLSELVRHNENSLVFSNHKELADQLKLWFENFPNNTVQQGTHNKFRQELNKFQEMRWHDNWLCNMLPRLQK